MEFFKENNTTTAATMSTTGSKLRRNVSIKRKLFKTYPLIKKELENEIVVKQTIECLIESIMKCNVINVRHQLENGANPNTKFNNWSLLHYACSLIEQKYFGTDQHLDLIKLLLEYGAEINSKDEDSWTPLHFACQLGVTRVISFLVKNGADCHASTVENLRPIDLVEPDNLAAISSLIYTGSSNTVTNERP